MHEPRLEISNFVVCATSKGSDQPALTRSLIKAFASCTVKLLTKQHLGFLNFKGGCTGSSESTLVKMPHCWKSHVAVHMFSTELLKVKRIKIGEECGSMTRASEAYISNIIFMMEDVLKQGLGKVGPGCILAEV